MEQYWDAVALRQLLCAPGPVEYQGEVIIEPLIQSTLLDPLTGVHHDTGEGEGEGQLGETGLARKQAELGGAMEMKGASAPDSLLTSLPIPSSNSILVHKVTSVNTNSPDQLDNFDLKRMPVFLQFDQISSNFVDLLTMLNTDQVPQALKHHLHLLLELLLESPFSINRVDTPHETVVAQLSEDCLASSTSRSSPQVGILGN